MENSIERVRSAACSLQVAVVDGSSRLLLNLLESQLGAAVKDANHNGATYDGVENAIVEGSERAGTLRQAA